MTILVQLFSSSFFSVLIVCFNSLPTSRSMLRSPLTAWRCSGAFVVQLCLCSSRSIIVPPSPPSSAGVWAMLVSSSWRGLRTGIWSWRRFRIPLCWPAIALHRRGVSALFPSVIESSRSSSCSFSHFGWFSLLRFLMSFCVSLIGFFMDSRFWRL